MKTSFWGTILILFIGLIVGLSSCSDDRTYDRYQAVSALEWDRNDTLKYSIPRQWKGRYMLDIGIVTTKKYPYRGISLIVNRKRISHQHRKKVEQLYVDTIQCQVIDNNGNVLGQDGISKNMQRSHIRALDLQTNDSIYITVNHIMSKDALTGVMGIGIRLTRTEPYPS